MRFPNTSKNVVVETHYLGQYYKPEWEVQIHGIICDQVETLPSLRDLFVSLQENGYDIPTEWFQLIDNYDSEYMRVSMERLKKLKVFK
jgi:hypothetical protein